MQIGVDQNTAIYNGKHSTRILNWERLGHGSPVNNSYDTLSYYTFTLHNFSVPALGHCVRECKLPIRRMGKLDKGKSLVGGEWVTITCNEGFRITVSSGIIGFRITVRSGVKGCLLDRRVLRPVSLLIFSIKGIWNLYRTVELCTVLRSARLQL